MVAFVAELFFDAVFELITRFFRSDFPSVRAAREPNEPRSDYGYAPGIVGLTVFLSLLISGLWFSYLRS